MNLPNLSKGIWALPNNERKQVFAYLRSITGLSENRPSIPIPADKIDAVSKRVAECVQADAAPDPNRAPLVADMTLLTHSMWQYTQAPTDDFLNSLEPVGAAYAASGAPPLILSGATTPLLIRCWYQVADEMLSPQEAAEAKKYAPAAITMLVAMFLEGYFASYSAQIAEGAAQEAALERFLKISGMSRDLYENMLSAYEGH